MIGKRALVNRILKPLGFELERSSVIQQLWRESTSGNHIIELLMALPADKAVQLVPFLKRSRSQLAQDLFVLSALDFKRGGYFVEFGATDGVALSNTYLLEAEFGWRGILAEPARCWHSSLRANRSAAIETDCVWSHSNAELKFREVSVPEISTVDDFAATDFLGDLRKHGKTYVVRTISLIDMLIRHGAPRTIDYLSIDTEGSELEILKEFCYDKYNIRVITCEHNYTKRRDEIEALLYRHGYQRVLAEVSDCDDWYIRA